MVTQTPPAPSHGHAAGSSHHDGPVYHDPQPIDPLHDIDGRRTMTWVAVFAVTVFASMWLLSIVYQHFFESAMQDKIYDRPALELQQLRDREHAELTRTEDLGGGRERISIDEAIRRLSKD